MNFYRIKYQCGITLVEAKDEASAIIKAFGFHWFGQTVEYIECYAKERDGIYTINEKNLSELH